MQRDPSNCMSYRKGECGICDFTKASTCPFFSYVPILQPEEKEYIESATTTIDRINNRKPRRSDERPIYSPSPTHHHHYENEIFDRLRAWRLQRSRSMNLPAYVIFHDKTLHEIATSNIHCKEDLLFVSGIGKEKYLLYADDIFAILKPYIDD